jgi:hypothetical protein
MSKSCVLVNLLRGYKILLREIDKNRGANGATCDGDIWDTVKSSSFLLRRKYQGTLSDENISTTDAHAELHTRKSLKRLVFSFLVLLPESVFVSICFSRSLLLIGEDDSVRSDFVHVPVALQIICGR